MKQEKSNFRHESLQDRDSIQQILQAITQGVEKGKLILSDEDGEIQLKPDGLLNLKVTASREESRDRLNIRITWHTPVERKKRQKTLTIADK